MRRNKHMKRRDQMKGNKRRLDPDRREERHEGAKHRHKRHTKIEGWLGPNPRAVDDGVQVSEIITRRYGQPVSSSDVPLANPVEHDTRHYCRHCKRKREERFMIVIGRAAFGKNSWACNDDRKLCAAIRLAKQKQKEAARS